MYTTSAHTDTQDAGASPARTDSIDGNGATADRRLVTDGGSGEATADDRESVYDKHSYDFAWYFTKRGGWRTALIGTVLLAGSFLVVPGLVLLGYMYRVGRTAARGEGSPPPLEDWRALAKDGARFLVLLVPVTLLVLIPLVGAYVGLAVLAAYVGTGSLTDAATYRSAGQILLSVSYLVWFVEYLVYLSAMWILTALVIGVGWVLGPGFIMVSSGAFLGFVYHQAREKEIIAAPATASA
ncbi:DUF4013 domain-containing protein [Halobacteriales archaeon Cl-PHB]